MNDSMRDRPPQAFSSHGLPATTAGYTTAAHPSTGRSPVQHHQDALRSMTGIPKVGPSQLNSTQLQRSSLDRVPAPSYSPRAPSERLPSLKEILAASRSSGTSENIVQLAQSSHMKTPQFRMPFSSSTESYPVEPAEPDPFTSRPYPLTGNFPTRPSLPFPGPLQLPAGNPQASGATHSYSSAPNTVPYQSSHANQLPQRHDSFSTSRNSLSQTPERRATGLFLSPHDPYCNPLSQRHDSAGGLEGRSHPHTTGASERYMIPEPTAAVLHYASAHQERDPSVYASGPSSSNDIQGATIMGYGSGGLIYIRKRRGNLPKEATNFLKKWFDEHMHNPYPTEEDKQWMVRKTGLEANQISNWFINARRRRKHNRSPEHHYPDGMSPSSEPPSPTISGMDTPLQSPARPPPGYP